MPTLYERGQAVEPKDVVVYYGSRLTDPARTVPFPQGFRMIAGDARLQVPTPDGSVNQFYCAGPGGEIGRSADGNWPVCAPTATLMFQLVFQDCWDGVHLDSPDHKAHVSYTYDGTCSGDFPVAIPSVSFLIAYPTSGVRRRLPAVVGHGVVDARRRVHGLGQHGARPAGEELRRAEGQVQHRRRLLTRSFAIQDHV